MYVDAYVGRHDRGRAVFLHDGRARERIAAQELRAVVHERLDLVAWIETHAALSDDGRRHGRSASGREPGENRLAETPHDRDARGNDLGRLFRRAVTIALLMRRIEGALDVGLRRARLQRNGHRIVLADVAHVDCMLEQRVFARHAGRAQPRRCFVLERAEERRRAAQALIG